jgi:hypothetical protein
MDMGTDRSHVAKNKLRGNDKLVFMAVFGCGLPSESALLAETNSSYSQNKNEDS